MSEEESTKGDSWEHIWSLNSLYKQNSHLKEIPAQASLLKVSCSHKPMPLLWNILCCPEHRGLAETGFSEGQYKGHCDHVWRLFLPCTVWEHSRTRLDKGVILARASGFRPLSPQGRLTGWIRGRKIFLKPLICLSYCIAIYFTSSLEDWRVS